MRDQTPLHMVEYFASPSRPSRIRKFLQSSAHLSTCQLLGSPTVPVFLYKVCLSFPPSHEPRRTLYKKGGKFSFLTAKNHAVTVHIRIFLCAKKTFLCVWAAHEIDSESATPNKVMTKLIQQ